MMDARTLRTLERFLALFLAAGAGDALVQFATSNSGTYDWRHLVGALAAAAIMALEQWLKNTGDSAPPSVGAVNATLQTALESPLVSVPPPKVAIPAPTTIVTLQSEDSPPPH